MLLFILSFALLMCLLQFRKGDEGAFDKKATVPLRGVLILMIFFGHASSVAHLHYTVVEWLCPMELAVGGFFFLSGYGLTVSFKNRGMSYLNGFLFRAVIKLLLPVIVLGGLWQIYLFLTQGSVSPVSDLIKHGKPPLPASWFALELFLLYVMFAGACRFSDGKRLFMLVFPLSIVLIGVMIAIPGWGPQWWTATLAFPFGVAYAEYQNVIRTKRALVIILLTLILVGCGLCSRFVKDSLAFNGARVLCNGVFGICCAEVMKKAKFNFGMLTYFGNMSYAIYLVHVSVLLMLLPLSSSGVLYVLCSFILTIGLAFPVNAGLSMIKVWDK